MQLGWRLLIVAAIGLGILHAQSSGRQQAWFADGTGLEIYSAATGSTKPSSPGVTGIGPGVGKKDSVFRVLVDGSNNVLFAYNLEASHAGSPETVTIRILPLSSAMQESMLSSRSRWSVPGGHVPTVTAMREFSPVRIGEVVTVDVLFNRSTGEKIYDILRPLGGPSRGNLMVAPSPPREEISLQEIVVRVNNKIVRAPSSWLIGGAVRIDIPRHGAFVLAVNEPRNLPPIYEFRPLGHANGKVLNWSIGRDTFKIESSTNVLTQAAVGVLWVYHDSRYLSQDQPDTVSLQTADSVEWLIPRRNDK